MGVNKTALKSPSGLMKIVALLLTVIVLILVRTGFPGGTQASFLHTDHLWLSIIAAGGYIIILGVMLATYVLGDAMPDKTELLFMGIGAVLFIAVGAMAIQHHDKLVGGSRRDTGLAMGSIAIIDGAVMLADALFLAKAIFKK